MEMHQVRYFLAVARHLNFTRAAEECNVAQPSLTRAVKLLEEELGGELFRRERNFTHLTGLGQRMLPMMQHCYDSAQHAKSLAQSIKSGAIAPLTIAVSEAFNLTLLVGFLSELVRTLPGLELALRRGAGAEIASLLQNGDADVAIGGPLGVNWDRLETWPLFDEPYVLVVGASHALAVRSAISSEELSGERMFIRTFCENSREIREHLEAMQLKISANETFSERDTIELLSRNLGVSVMPESSAAMAEVRRLPLDGLQIVRRVAAYSVAGRQRSLAASTLIKMLRAADWRTVTRDAAA